jgi:hypothetical protein
MNRSKIFAKVELSDAQFEGMDKNTRRDLIKQVMFIKTPKYEYCIGAQGVNWTIVRYDVVDASSVDKDSAEIIDKWV